MLWVRGLSAWSVGLVFVVYFDVYFLCSERGGDAGFFVFGSLARGDSVVFVSGKARVGGGASFMVRGHLERGAGTFGCGRELL